MPQHHGQQTEDELGWFMRGSSREVADVLMEFAQELRNGDVNVWKGQRELHLRPNGPIEFRVEAIVDQDGREGLHLRLHWEASSDSMDLHSGANMGVPLGEQGALGSEPGE